MDYAIHSHQELIDRVHEYFTLMHRAKYEKQKLFKDQEEFWYKYGRIKDSIKHYVKKHRTICQTKESTSTTK